MSMLVVCPACEKLNRTDPGRAREARCGQCQSALFEGHPLLLNSATFDRHLVRGDVPLLVDFWAPWCGPCRSMAPAFDKAAAQLEPRLRLGKINTEEEPQLAQRFQIRSIPTLILFGGGREVARQAGAMGLADIVRWAHDMTTGAVR